MLTKRDIQTLKEIFITQDDFNEFRGEIKNDILQFKDDILWEIKAMREEMTIMIGYRGTIEDHEQRIKILEEISPNAKFSL